jgi:hypothetical protein
MPLPDVPPDIEEIRDSRWWRENAKQVTTPLDAERFVEQVGFAWCLADARTPGPSLYVAVCGRRDAMMPRHAQKDHEASLTWNLKDAVLRRGKIYYAKLARGRAMFIAPRMLPHFHALWGVKRADEAKRLSRPARRVVHVLRHEWEMGTKDLRDESGITDRAAFSRALDELQAAMLVIPSDVVYEPSFTYIWTLGVGRFPDGLRRRVSRETALREIARCFLTTAHLTVRGELARVIGVSRSEAGRGNRALVKEGFATMLETGVYRLTEEPRVTDGPA